MRKQSIPLTFLTSIIIGTVLEWYDFSLLGSMAAIISPLFFPMQSKLLSLLMTFSIFASGFLARPIGGILFGHLGDKHGRKYALSLTIMLMAIPTTLIGMLPTFQSIGIAAPILLISLRLIQGVASSGEYPGAICWLAEVAPAGKKGFWCSISMLGVTGGFLLATAICWLLTEVLSTEQINVWGWRIPFFVGLPLGISGWYIREKVYEPAAYVIAKNALTENQFPISQLLANDYISVLKVIALFSLSTIVFYTTFIYVPGYITQTYKIPYHKILLDNSIGIAFTISLFPVFGFLSDKINYKYFMLAGAMGIMLFFYPIYTKFLISKNHMLIGQLITGAFIAMFAAPMAAKSAEIFPINRRYSGISLGLNFGASIFGGTCPLIATYLVYYTNDSASPCFYPICFAFICIFIIFSLRERHAESACSENTKKNVTSNDQQDYQCT